MQRRDFLRSALAGTGAAVTGILPAFAAQSMAQIDSLFDRAIVIDALSNERWDDAGFAAWAQSGYTGIQTSLSDRDFAAAANDLAQWHRRFQQYPDKFIHCAKADDIERAKREQKLAVILGFQNATMIGNDLGNLQKLYEAGARCIQLTYNSRNLLGDGCTERTNAGLSDFGIECVEKMNELGIVVDLSHCGEQTTADGIAYSVRPPAFTHTMCKSIYYHPRAKSDELLRALSNRGGVTGIVALGYFVSPNPNATIEDYVNHIDRAVKVCGIDHVGLATDYAIRGIEVSATRETWYLPRLTEFKPSYNVRWPPWIAELDKPGRLRNVARALERRSYKAGEIEKILGQNWLRYFREIFGG